MTIADQVQQAGCGRCGRSLPMQDDLHMEFVVLFAGEHQRRIFQQHDDDGTARNTPCQFPSRKHWRLTSTRHPWMYRLDLRPDRACLMFNECNADRQPSTGTCAMDIPAISRPSDIAKWVSKATGKSFVTIKVVCSENRGSTVRCFIEVSESEAGKIAKAVGGFVFGQDWVVFTIPVRREFSCAEQPDGRPPADICYCHSSFRS
jgi:hypothetical protein